MEYSYCRLVFHKFYRVFFIILFIHLLCLAAKRNANFHNYHRKNLMWFPHFVSGTKANELPKKQKQQEI